MSQRKKHIIYGIIFFSLYAAVSTMDYHDEVAAAQVTK